MKKIVLGLLIGALLVAPGQVFAEWIDVAVNPVKIYANNKIVETDNFIVNGVTYVPLRAVSEQLGMYVDYDSETSTIDVYDDGTKTINTYLIHYMHDIMYVMDEVEFYYKSISDAYFLYGYYNTDLTGLYASMKKIIDNDYIQFYEERKKLLNMDSVIEYDLFIDTYKDFIDEYRSFCYAYETHIAIGHDPFTYIKILYDSISDMYFPARSDLRDEYYKAYNFVIGWNSK